MRPFAPARPGLGDRLWNRLSAQRRARLYGWLFNQLSVRLRGRLAVQLRWNLADPLSDHLRSLVDNGDRTR